MKTARQFLILTRHALTIAVLMLTPMLSVADELDDLMKSTNVDEQGLLEQLKSAESLLTAEFWKNINDPHRPGAKEPDREAEARAHEKGIKALDEIEALSGLSDNVLVELYQLRQIQYSKIDNNTLKYEEYTNKLLALENCPPRIAEDAQARLASLGSPWQVFRAYYVDCLPEDLIERRKNAFETHALEKIKEKNLTKDPGLAADYCALGQMYWADGENDKAEKYFLEIMKQKDVSKSKVEPKYIGDAMMFLASIELRRGNRDKALQYCKDLLAKNYPGLDNSRSCYSTPALHAAKAVRHWKDDYTQDLDNLKLPHYTDCKPYPSPQEPEYTDKYVQLKSVRFEGGKDFPKDHPVFRLIGVKFKRYGISISDNAPFTIRVNTARHPDTPDKPQGYYLDISSKEAVISGNDYQGTVWGVVSFIQCVDPETGKARICKVRDWPVTMERGHSGYGDDLVEFGLFNKLNFFFNQTYCFTDAGLPDKDVIYENLKYMAKPFADFGLDFYVADRTCMYPKMSITSDRTFQYHLERDLKLASYGANISIILDDGRYPLNKLDAKVDDGHGRKIDNQYVQKLYLAVKEKYPDIKMVFCPTYYWGPHWKNEQYADSRTDYFEGIRTCLDPEIRVFWSGNQVKGYHKSRDQVKWFIDSAGRKPMVWQNAMGQHWAMGYGCEVIPWGAWHYEGFFGNDCVGLMANATFPRRAIELAAMADALWRPGPYRESEEYREASLRRATDQLCGQGVYDLLRPGTKALSYMDRYLWSNGMTLNQHLYEENREDIEELYDKADGGMKKALQINPSANTYSGHYWCPLSTMKRLLEQFDNPTSYYNLPEYKKPLGMNLKIAEKEAGYNQFKDVLGNAFDFQVGKPVVVDKRACVQYFPKSPSRKGVWKFNLPNFPESYELKICGRLVQEGEPKPTIRITLNKQKLYEGPAKFTHDSWTFMNFDISWMDLAETDNKLTIENISPREKWSKKPLTYYINYAVMKAKGKEGEDSGGDQLMLDGLME